MLDARAAFRRSRPFTTIAIDHGVAVCELRYRSGTRSGGIAEQVVNTTAAFVTLGVSEAIRNANEPDIAGIDLLLGARFGRGELYRARGAYGAFRTYVTIPVRTLRAGDSVWMRLRDEDQVTRDDVLGEWSLRFDGSSPIVARHGRAAVECRLLPREVVERRVGVSVTRAERDIARMRRAAPAAITRIEHARRPLDVVVRAFDDAALRADTELTLARANTADPSAWPNLAAAERAFDEALALVAAARAARLARGFGETPTPAAPTANAIPLCSGRSPQVLLSLLSDPPTPSRRITRAFAIDTRGVVHLVRFLRAPPSHDPGPRSFAIARIEDFDVGNGRRPCAAPTTLLLSSGRTQWATPVE